MRPALSITGRPRFWRWVAGLERPYVFLIGIAVLVLAVPIWMGFAPVDRVVRVEGRVIPAGRAQEIQHLEGGIVASIDAHEGALVKQGDLLLTIDDTAAAATLSEVRIKLDSQRAKVLRLQAQARDMKSLTFPADLAGTDVADAEHRLFDAQRAKLAEDIAVHESAVTAQSSEIQDAQDRRERLLAEHATAIQRLDMVRKMVSQEAASKMEVLEAESREQRLRTEISDAEGLVPKLQAGIAEERARIATVKAEFIAQAINDLSVALAEADGLKERQTSDADRMRRTEVRAPCDGVVNRITINTVGGVVKPGETVIELTPTLAGVLIEARAQPKDRAYLRVGLTSKIRVSAFDPGEYGVLTGQVTEVSGDSMQDAHNDTTYYQVDILVQSLPNSFSGHTLVPGMTVTADVVTGRRTVLSYLLSPVNRFTYSMFRDAR